MSFEKDAGDGSGAAIAGATEGVTQAGVQAATQGGGLPAQVITVVTTVGGAATAIGLGIAELASDHGDPAMGTTAGIPSGTAPAADAGASMGGTGAPQQEVNPGGGSSPGTGAPAPGLSTPPVTGAEAAGVAPGPEPAVPGAVANAGAGAAPHKGSGLTAAIGAKAAQLAGLTGGAAGGGGGLTGKIGATASGIAAVGLGAAQGTLGNEPPPPPDLSAPIGATASGIAAVGLGAAQGTLGNEPPPPPDLSAPIGATASGIAAVGLGAAQGTLGNEPPPPPDLSAPIGATASGIAAVGLGAAQGTLENPPPPPPPQDLGAAIGAVAAGIAAVGLAVSGAKGPKKAMEAASGVISASDELPVFDEIAVTSTPSAVSGLVEEALDSAIDHGTSAVFGPISGKNLEVEVASGDGLDVRQFSIHERMSSLFQVQLIVLTDNADLDFDSIVGQPAKFTIHTNPGMSAHEPRVWTGLCNHLQQISSESDGQSTYQLSIVPTLWLTTQRRNHRMFQQISEPDIVQKLLKEWEIDPDVRIDKAAYKKRKYRVQYGESDFDFMSRMLEDAGISFFFEQKEGETKLVLSDAPQKNKPRRGKLRYFDSPSASSERYEHATSVRVGQDVRPGKYTVRDHDYRMPPSYQLIAEHTDAKGIESKLERFEYTPGAFLYGTDKGDATPSADDKGKTRTDQGEGALLAQRRLEAKRVDAKVVSFDTNALDIGPGMVLSFLDHPRADLAKDKKLLIVETACSGSSTGQWHKSCEARSADVPYRPPTVTPKPKVAGIESATVVGPQGEEIHTDEFGRVRVHFHWDRQSKMDDNSSCWMHVSHPWAGSGFGAINLPRVGQEVIVDFLGGDPDRPVVIGRLYTNLQKVPYKLPQHKTQSGWKSNSTNKTGGYNEIMFEDASGKELVNIQAEKDLTKLVKHDETETTNSNRTITVGKNRSATIGSSDTTTAGVQHSITIAGPDGSGVTSVTMSHQSITLTTGGATIALGPDSITLSAREISLETDENVNVAAGAQVVIDGDDAVLINCTDKPPPDEVQMPSTEDEFVDEVIGLIPYGKLLELGAKLVLGEGTVDAAKHQAAGYVRQGADAVHGFITSPGGTRGGSGFEGGSSGGGSGGGGGKAW